MARITTRPQEDEEDLVDDIEDEEDEVEEQVSAPAVSDRRRRRQLKRGEVVAEADDVVAPQTTRKERPTPSQRAETVKSSNFVVRFFQNVLEYFREVQAELSKVTWLSREDTLRLTYIVLVVTTISAAFLGLVSYIFGLLTQALAGTSTSIIAGAVTILLILGVAGAWLFRDSLFSRFE